jgi:hypothetical protein
VRKIRSKYRTNTGQKHDQIVMRVLGKFKAPLTLFVYYEHEVLASC